MSTHRPDRAADRVDSQPPLVGRQAAAGLHYLPGARPHGRHPRPAEQRDRRRRHRHFRTTWSPPSAPRASSSGSAPAPVWYHFTFNGARGSILADARLRRAICKGIDRQAIVDVVEHGLTGHPVPLDNHVLRRRPGGLRKQQRTSRLQPRCRPAENSTRWAGSCTGRCARKTANSWSIRDVFFEAQSNKQIAWSPSRTWLRSASNWCWTPSRAPDSSASTSSVGDFDIAQFGWVGDAFPLSALPQIYASDGDSNFGKIGSREIDAKIDRDAVRTRPGQGPRAGQRGRPDDLAGRIQPAAVPIVRRRRGAQRSGQLRRVRAGRRRSTPRSGSPETEPTRDIIRGVANYCGQRTFDGWRQRRSSS